MKGLSTIAISFFVVVTGFFLACDRELTDVSGIDAFINLETLDCS